MAEEEVGAGVTGHLPALDEGWFGLMALCKRSDGCHLPEDLPTENEEHHQ